MPNIDLKSDKKIIGIQTGTSLNYNTRSFSKDKLISLIPLLTEKYDVVLLGGTEEEALNKHISEKTKAKYFGSLSLKEFMGLVSLCDLIITPVTFVLHLAISLNKKIILVNNVLPANEFYLYGLGVTLEPDISCKRCYKTKFDKNCIKENCMDLIKNETILDAVDNLLNEKN